MTYPPRCNECLVDEADFSERVFQDTTTEALQTQDDEANPCGIDKEQAVVARRYGGLLVVTIHCGRVVAMVPPSRRRVTRTSACFDFNTGFKAGATSNMSFAIMLVPWEDMYAMTAERTAQKSHNKRLT